MKPIYLEMNAFGAFCDKTSLDFSLLEESGVYLIEGETGSGKTTIFDAILFALYGDPTSEAKDAKSKFRSDFATDKEETYVKFIFELYGNQYSITRTPQYSVSNRKTPYPTTILLEGPNQTIITNVLQANKKIQELLQLDSTQFREIVMLAQGEFRKFIEADSKSREQLLSKIFQTSQYSAFQNKFLVASKKRGDELNQTQAIIHSDLLKFKAFQAMEEFFVIGYEAALENTANLPGFILNLKKASLEKEEEYQIISLEKSQIEKKIDESIRNIEKAQEINKNLHSFQTALDGLRKLDARKEEMNLLQEQIKIHDELNLYISSYEKYLHSEEEIESLTNRLKSSLIEKEELEEKYKDWKAKNTTILELQQNLETNKKNVEAILTLQGNYKQAQKAEKEYKNYFIDFCKFHEVANKKQIEFMELEQYYIQSTAARLAIQLEDSKPCPVCGSTQHPKKAVFSGREITEEEYKNAKKENEEYRAQVEEKNNVLTSKNQTFIECKNLLEKEGISYDFFSLEESLSHLQNTKKLVVSLEQEIQEIQEKNKEYEKKKNEIDSRIQTLQDSKDRNTEAYSINQKELTVLFESGAHICSIEDFKKYYHDGFSLASERKKYERYQNEHLQMQTNYDSLVDQVKDKEYMDITILSNEEQKLRDQKKILDKSYEEKKEYSRATMNLVESLSKEYKEYERLLKEKGLLDYLSKIANGSLGTRISFERYILGDYFDQILESANLRLKEMTQNRYWMKRVQGSTGGVGSQGLEIEVLDAQTGKSRPISTLSGGESFIASLSLALGLADIIQAQCGVIDMKSLFIDEGFGTLDQDALENSMKILVSMAKTGKTIGIISHVKELKDFVDVSVHVYKDPSGRGSHLKIERK